MAVTPVACRYILGNNLEHGRVGKAIEHFIDGVADGYSRVLRRTLPFRWTIVSGCALLVAGSVWAATRLPSTFFPEIDESMDQIYLRFAPGMSVDQAQAQLNAITNAIRAELPGVVEMVIGNIGTPQNARAAIVSPNAAPNTGFLRLQFSDPETRKLSQQEIAVKAREIINREFPGVEALQAPGGLVASVFANGYIAPLVVEVRGENLDEMDAQAKAIAEVARTIPGIVDVRTSLQNDYPELRVETPRTKAGLVGVSSREAAETTLEATLGNVNTPGVWIRTMVKRTTSSPSTIPRRSATAKAWASCPSASTRKARPYSLDHTETSGDRSAPSSSSATTWSAPSTSSCRSRTATSARRGPRSRRRSTPTRGPTMSSSSSWVR
jgi:multidrug efflux pump subunit AcrB